MDSYMVAALFGFFLIGFGFLIETLAVHADDKPLEKVAYTFLAVGAGLILWSILYFVGVTWPD